LQFFGEFGTNVQNFHQKVVKTSAMSSKMEELVVVV
jgi:hypothetical protein